MIPVLKPFLVAASAESAVTIDFPTPPLPETTPITFFTELYGLRTALTELLPEILTMVDNGKIALTPAVELSYLRKQEQQDLLETMESEDCTPSLSQAIQMKKLSQLGFLDMDKIFEILRKPKANQQDKISFRVDDLRKYFPKSYTASRIQGHILKLLEADLRKRQREQSR